MRILVCDMCGDDWRDRKGIIGREFETGGYTTLRPSFRPPGVTDVCAGCLKKVERAVESERDRERKTTRQRITEVLRGLSPNFNNQVRRDEA